MEVIPRVMAALLITMLTTGALGFVLPGQTVEGQAAAYSGEKAAKSTLNKPGEKYPISVIGTRSVSPKKTSSSDSGTKGSTDGKNEQTKNKILKAADPHSQQQQKRRPGGDEARDFDDDDDAAPKGREFDFSV